MTRELAEVIAAGKALDADEREIAALALQHVEDDEQAAIDDAWEEEIDRRVDDILSGKVELVDGEETFRMIRAELAARRHDT
ncbi:addiction module protein [Flexivirga caeni]|uniref:Addiction module protein n=1 Tax=Flexivirga caeni TaxID=2294115 RepID=A0A3M9M9Z7_9MICO|nr:addiction module protein [Flexivirga caeni]RNI21683.1 addiction module protein [Flexivirga caeni]